MFARLRRALARRDTTSVPVVSEFSTDRPSSSSPPRFQQTPKQLNAADDDDDVDKKSTSYDGGRDTVVQLGVDNKPEVVVDGGKLISANLGDDSALVSAAGKISPVDGCEVGGISGDQDGNGGCCWRCRSRLSRLCQCFADGVAGCHAAWLSGIGLAQECVHGLLTRHLGLIKRVLLALVLVGFAAYLAVAVWKSGLCAIAVIVVAALILFIQCLRLLKRLCGQRIDTHIIAPVRQVRHRKPCLCLKW